MLPATIVEILVCNALKTPERELFHFLEGDLSIKESLRLSTIHEQLYSTAFTLQSYQGEPCLILLPKSAAFIHAFFGCLAAQVIAVPLPAPRRGVLSARHKSVLQQSGARVVITNRALYEEVKQKESADFLEQVDWVMIEDILEGQDKVAALPSLSTDDIAILQYTSGSTGAPKGVMVSHLNFLTDALFIMEVTHNNEESCGVCWLPSFHDMGLVMGVIEPVFVNYPIYHLQPYDFVTKPARWPLAMSKYKATITGGPNFAFDLAARKSTPEQVAEMDLSALRVWYNGAETIRPATLDLVCEVFAPAGFKRSMLLPCYGMAETTLAASLTALNEPPFLDKKTILGDKERVFVSAGNLGVDTVVKIVDPVTCEELPLERIGEIWAKGNIVCQGYWKIDDSETFNLSLNGEDGYFRTGDLGYMYKDHLFIVDRLKDLVIINGVNYYPADMEVHLSEVHPAVNHQGIAAFSIDQDNKEQVIIAAEISREACRDQVIHEEIRSAIRKTFFQRFGFTLKDVVLLIPLALPRTSSGKISRSNTRKLYLTQKLRTV